MRKPRLEIKQSKLELKEQGEQGVIPLDYT